MTAARDTLNALLDGLLPAADNAGAPIIAAQEWNALKPTPHAGDGEKGPNADEAALLADEVTRGANAPDAMRVVPSGNKREPRDPAAVPVQVIRSLAELDGPAPRGRRRASHARGPRR